MIRQFWCIVLAMLLAGAHSSSLAKPRTAAYFRKKASDWKPGYGIAAKLTNKEQVKGKIVAITDSGLEIMTKIGKEKVPRSIGYDQMAKLRRTMPAWQVGLCVGIVLGLFVALVFAGGGSDSLSS